MCHVKFKCEILHLSHPVAMVTVSIKHMNYVVFMCVCCLSLSRTLPLHFTSLHWFKTEAQRTAAISRSLGPKKSRLTVTSGGSGSHGNTSSSASRGSGRVNPLRYQPPPYLGDDFEMWPLWPVHVHCMCTCLCSVYVTVEYKLRL